jgi:hypothetical protein
MLTKTDLKAIDKVLAQKPDQKLEEKFEGSSRPRI